MNTILVQMSDRQWTMQAMHLACAMARNTQCNLVLLHLMQVTNPALLGTGLGIDSPSQCEYEDLEQYEMIAEDYGVALIVQPMGYESLTEAIVQAVEKLKASVVFAHLPKSVFAFGHRLQEWNLRRQLTEQHCHLYTLDQPGQTEEWMPSASLSVNPVKKTPINP